MFKYLRYNDWYNFRLGYHAALDDLERTGRQPQIEQAKEKAARKSWRHLTGRRVPEPSEP